MCRFRRHGRPKRDQEGKNGSRVPYFARRLQERWFCMPLLIVLLALLLPRLTIIVLWLMSNWFEGIFTNPFWPIIGFIFLPLTLLWYTVVQHWFGRQWDIIPIVGLIIALIIDISPTTRYRRRRAVVIEE